MRIIAWRVERILLVKKGKIEKNRHASNLEDSFKRINRYLEKIDDILNRYHNCK